MRKTKFFLWFEGVKMYFKSKDRMSYFKEKIDIRNKIAEEARERFWYRILSKPPDNMLF